VNLAPLVSLVFLVAFGAVAFGWRVWLQLRRTADTGIRCFPRSSLDWTAGVTLVLGMIAVVLAPVADMIGLLERFDALDHLLVAIVGGAVFLAGFILTIRAQLDLGDSWRIGLDLGETTPLVTEGVFRVVRNPVFTGIALAFAGSGLIVPNILAGSGWLLFACGLEVQVRWVEEPHLRRCHGARYLAYASAVGRFLPGVGRSN
jgi:protein-S-isoprenylcysteine O-methyltransferase Ste14